MIVNSIWNNTPDYDHTRRKIDRLLDNSGNNQGRMAVLGMLMQGKLLELQKELCSLTEVLIKNINPK